MDIFKYLLTKQILITKGENFHSYLLYAGFLLLLSGAVPSLCPCQHNSDL